MGLGGQRLVPVGLEALVARAEAGEVLDARDLVPDEVGGVVGDALRVGLGEAHRHLGRESNPSIPPFYCARSASCRALRAPGWRGCRGSACRGGCRRRRIAPLGPLDRTAGPGQHSTRRARDPEVRCGECRGRGGPTPILIPPIGFVHSTTTIATADFGNRSRQSGTRRSAVRIGPKRRRSASEGSSTLPWSAAVECQPGGSATVTPLYRRAAERRPPARHRDRVELQLCPPSISPALIVEPAGETLH